jgi:cytochrome c biogenesis protein ResB
MLPEFILLEKNLGLWLLPPEPKKYESVLVISTMRGEPDTVMLEVNRPFKTGGWSFYQSGYEEEMGAASQLSIIEAVYDPWLPVVYTGIILMLAGACHLFWQGRGQRVMRDE